MTLVVHKLLLILVRITVEDVLALIEQLLLARVAHVLLIALII